MEGVTSKLYNHYCGKVILFSSRGVVHPNDGGILMAQEIIIFLLGGAAEFSAPEGALKSRKRQQQSYTGVSLQLCEPSELVMGPIIGVLKILNSS